MSSAFMTGWPSSDTATAPALEQLAELGQLLSLASPW